MNKGVVTISVEKYKKFIAMEARIEAFAAYVNTRQYIESSICGAFLDFDVKKSEND